MSNNILLGSKEYFPNINKITYEGTESTNPLAFKYYNEDSVVSGKTMRVGAPEVVVRRLEILELRAHCFFFWLSRLSR